MLEHVHIHKAFFIKYFVHYGLQTFLLMDGISIKITPLKVRKYQQLDIYQSPLSLNKPVVLINIVITNFLIEILR